ncbi:hypothetical protein HZB01_02070 [Candidatus Woesearchaeota archaeon]|nr:hypothetical protein [Candidatus Woesearchaeota archaeon]
MYISKGNHYGFFNRDVERAIATQHLEEQKKNPDFIASQIAAWHAACTKTREFWKEIEKLSKLSDDALLALARNYDDARLAEWNIAVMIEVFDPWTEELLTKEVRLADLQLTSDEIHALIAPEQLSMTAQRQLDLVKTALRFYDIRGAAGISMQMQKLSDQYFWSNNDWGNVHYLHADFFREEMETLWLLQREELKIMKQELEGYSSATFQRKQEIHANHAIPPPLDAIFSFFSLMSIWRDERKVHAQKCNHHAHHLLEECSRRSNIPARILVNAIPLELQSLSLSPVFLEELALREECCIGTLDNQKNPHWLYGEKAKEVFSQLNATLGLEELRGRVACRGKATGTVRVILTPADFSKMEKGDILVAPMTRPEYTPLMKIAGAIVTDEGGVTSHAAIVSRELNVPCIIGVQHATTTLKDGEVVEVDAEEGVIRKI